MSKILITAKISPDLDGVACAFAYAKLKNEIDKGNEYIAWFFGRPHIEAQYLVERFKIDEGLLFDPKIKFDKFILVDASEMKGMPEVIRVEDVIEVIDHREIHNAYELFPNATIQIEKVGAAATLIFEKFIAKNITPDLNTAILLLGAIYSNTLNFKSSVVNQRDRDAVQLIMEKYKSEIPTNLIEEMFLHKSKYVKNNLEEVIISDFKSFENGLSIAQLEGYDFDKIIEVKLSEIKDILNNLKMNYNSRYIFLTIADIKNNNNIFVAIDNETERLLKDNLGVIFDVHGVAKNKELLLRKQIMPKLINNL